MKTTAYIFVSLGFTGNVIAFVLLLTAFSKNLLSGQSLIEIGLVGIGSCLLCWVGVQIDKCRPTPR